MNINDVANWVENIGNYYSTQKADELRETYNKLGYCIESTDVVEKWMIDMFEDGNWGFGSMQYDFYKSGLIMFKHMQCKVSTYIPVI
jgi:hypothetical protein